MPPELVRKLGFKGEAAAIINAPPGYALGIDAASDFPALLAFVQVFVADASELHAAVTTWLDQTVPDPVVWVTYPKQRSGRANRYQP